MTGDPESFMRWYYDHRCDVPGLRGVASPWPPRAAGGERLTPPWRDAGEHRTKHTAQPRRRRLWPLGRRSNRP